MSTGPITPEGKERSLANLKQYRELQIKVKLLKKRLGYIEDQ
jgi:hypothetical protein